MKAVKTYQQVSLLNFNQTATKYFRLGDGSSQESALAQEKCTSTYWGGGWVVLGGMKWASQAAARD